MTFSRLCIAGLVAGGALSAPAQAQESEYPKHVVTAGWLHFFTLEQDEPLTTHVAPSPVTVGSGIPETFSSPGTGSSVNDGDTLLLAYSYFFTPNWAVELNGGIPIEFEIQGKGVVMPNGDPSFQYNLDLGSAENNPLATTRQWSPTLLAQYHFFDPSKRLRPYLGLGFTYTWFTNVELDDNFVADLEELGGVLASGFGLSEETTVSAGAADSFTYAINAGLSYQLTDNWKLTGSLTYLGVETTATIEVRSADNNQILATSKADLQINPLVTGLLLSYQF